MPGQMLFSLPLDLQLDIYSYLSLLDLDNLSFYLSPGKRSTLFSSILNRRHRVLIRDATCDDLRFLDRYPNNIYRDREECMEDLNNKINLHLRRVEGVSQGEPRLWSPVLFDGRMYRAKTVEGAALALILSSSAYSGVTDLYTRIECPVIPVSSITDRYLYWKEEVAASLYDRLIEGKLPDYTPNKKTYAVAVKDITLKAMEVIRKRILPIREDRIFSLD